MIVAMAAIMGPAFGRLLPLPFLIPWAGWAVFVGMMLFPLAGAIHDRRRLGHVHPAWLWGMATLFVMQVGIDIVAWSGPGRALYANVVAGTPGAVHAPDAYPPFPPLP